RRPRPAVATLAWRFAVRRPPAAHPTIARRFAVSRPPAAGPSLARSFAVAAPAAHARSFLVRGTLAASRAPSGRLVSGPVSVRRAALRGARRIAADRGTSAPGRLRFARWCAGRRGFLLRSG